MPEEFDAGTRKAKNIMDSFIEALYGQSEETIPEEYDWFAPLLGDWEFEYKDEFIDGDRSRPQRQLKGEWIFRRVLNGIGIEDMFICPSRATRETSPQSDGEYVSDLEYIIQRPIAMIWYMHARVNLQICVLPWKMEY